MPRRMSSSSVRCSTHNESMVRMRTSRSTVFQSSSPTSACLAARCSSARSRMCSAMASRPCSSHRSSADVPSPVRPMAVHERIDLVVQEDLDCLGQVLVVEDLVALGVDRLTLLVDDVVVLDDALADVEVEALDPALRTLDRPRHEA